MSYRWQILLVGIVVLAYLGWRWWRIERQIQALEDGKNPSEMSKIEPHLEGETSSEVSASFDAPASGAPVSGSTSADLEGAGLTSDGVANLGAENGRDLGHFDSVDQAGAPAASEANADPDLAALERASQQAMVAKPAQLHPLIDCIAKMEMDEPKLGAVALQLMPGTRRIGSKTWRLEGQNAVTQEWQAVLPQQLYTSFRAGVQLVNRSGALNEIEFSEFVVKVSQLAEGLHASVDFPEMLREVARAREFEPFVRTHDIQLSVHLHAKGSAWSLGYVQQCAKQAGFVAGVTPGRWVLGAVEHESIALMIDPLAAMTPSMPTAEPVPIKHLTLFLDVPRAPRGPFDTLCQIAANLCTQMEAVILDEHGLVVEAQALQRTAQELDVIYNQMEASGVPAGSTLACRLFS